MATIEIPTKADLEQMTVPELKELAKEEGVHVAYDATKDETIKALEKHFKAEAKNHNANPSAAAAEGDAEVEPLAITGPVITLGGGAGLGAVSDLYGIGRKYNVALSDIQALGAVLQGNFLLENMPPGYIMQLVRIKHSVAVAGPSMTACTAQVQDTATPAANVFGTPFDVFQPIGPLATVQLTSGNVGSFGVVSPVLLTLVATGGAGFSTATQGAISVWLRWTVVA